MRRSGCRWRRACRSRLAVDRSRNVFKALLERADACEQLVAVGSKHAHASASAGFRCRFDDPGRGLRRLASTRVGPADCRGHGPSRRCAAGWHTRPAPPRQGGSRAAPRSPTPQGAYVEWPCIPVGDDTMYLLRIRAPRAANQPLKTLAESDIVACLASDFAEASGCSPPPSAMTAAAAFSSLRRRYPMGDRSCLRSCSRRRGHTHALAARRSCTRCRPILLAHVLEPCGCGAPQRRS